MNNADLTNKECDWKDENGYVTAVPNHTYIKLRLVKSNAVNEKNETIIMQANDDGKTFSIIKGDIVKFGVINCIRTIINTIHF